MFKTNPKKLTFTKSQARHFFCSAGVFYAICLDCKIFKTKRDAQVAHRPLLGLLIAYFSQHLAHIIEHIFFCLFKADNIYLPVCH